MCHPRYCITGRDVILFPITFPHFFPIPVSLLLFHFFFSITLSWQRKSIWKHFVNTTTEGHDRQPLPVHCETKAFPNVPCPVKVHFILPPCPISALLRPCNTPSTILPCPVLSQTSLTMSCPNPAIPILYPVAISIAYASYASLTHPLHVLPYPMHVFRWPVLCPGFSQPHIRPVHCLTKILYMSQ